MKMKPALTNLNNLTASLMARNGCRCDRWNYSRLPSNKNNLVV
jgi:hypothetical protein